MKRLLLAAAVLASLGALGIAPKEGIPRLVRVRAHPYERTVSAPGTLKASQSFRAFAPLDAVLLALLPEGTRVKKGDVVARLDVSEVADKLRDRTINRDITACELAIKDAEYQLEGYEVANRVAFAEQELAVSRLAREFVEHGIDYPEYVRDTKSLEANEALRRTLSQSLEEMKPHVPRGFVSRDDLEKQVTRLATEEIGSKVLSLERSLVVSGSPADARAKAVRDVEMAAGALGLARQKLATFEERRTDGLADLSTKLDGFKEEIAAYSEQVGRGTLQSPVAGVIIQAFIDSNTGAEKPKIGTRLPRGVMFAEVVQPGRVYLALELAEADAALVAEGQPVHFTADAYPGRSFEAKVSRVKATVTGGRWTRWIYPDIRQLDVVADVTAGDPGLLPEMTVTAQIVVESRPRALWIDVAAVVQGRITRPDGAVTKVQTGRVLDQEVEVVGGLSEGDEAIIVPDYAGDSPADQEVASVVQKDLPLTLTDAGSLEPVNVHEIAIPELDGEASIQMLAAEGAAVAKGEVVARLDTEALVGKLKERKLELAVAEKDREVAVEQARSDLNSLTQAEKVARLELEVATLDETIVNLGRKPREIDDLARDLAIQRVDIALISKKLELKAKLAGAGYVSAEEMKTLRQDLLNKQVNLEVALAKFELARAGASRVDRQKAVGNRAKAQLNHELARRKVASREAKRDLEIKKAQLGILKGRLAVERLERMIASLEVRAPVGGTLMRPEHWSNEGLRKYREGESVREGTVFAKIADLNRFLVKGVVPEDRVQSVKTGRAVRFWLASWAAEVHAGTVAAVGYVARDRGGRGFFDAEEPRVFDVEIATPVRHARFQPGLSVSFEVSVGEVKGALVIPLKGLHYDADGPFVFMSDGQRRRVKLGEEEKGEVQVTAGLAKGEEILVPRDDR